MYKRIGKYLGRDKGVTETDEDELLHSIYVPEAKDDQDRRRKEARGRGDGSGVAENPMGVVTEDDVLNGDDATEGPFDCSLCPEAKLPTLGNLKAHLQGRRHLNREARLAKQLKAEEKKRRHERKVKRDRKRRRKAKRAKKAKATPDGSDTD